MSTNLITICAYLAASLTTRLANWPSWYADYIVKEQAGKPLPT